MDLRRTQADEDREILDALIDEFMPSLREGIDGAREILMRRSADYRTQFAASARKAIDLAAKTLLGGSVNLTRGKPLEQPSKHQRQGANSDRHISHFVFADTDLPTGYGEHVTGLGDVGVVDPLPSCELGRAASEMPERAFAKPRRWSRPTSLW